MKLKLTLLSLFVITQVTHSLGASKKKLREKNEQMQEQLVMVQDQQILEAQQEAHPTRVIRELDPCEKLALMDSENFMAAGMAIADTENEAKNGAMADARNQLAQMVRVVVNNNNSSMGEDQMNQYVYQSLESTRPIKWSIYDLSNGQVQVYVCMEMTKKPSDFTTYINQNVTTNIGAMPISVVMPMAAANPEAEALCEMGRENCLKQNYDVGIPQLMKAVEMGSVNAQYSVGLLYLYGDNVEKNTKLAFQYISNAAMNNHKEATFQLGELYNSGTGVTKDKAQAKVWYTKAKELGDTRAESRLRKL